jgi:alpha-tubulin suppressor-like RCC1 family protein
MVVDELHGHVLVSGQESDSVAVLDLDGNRVSTIDNLPGAYGLVLSRDDTTLYVALASIGAIAAVDTATLLEVGRWRTSPMAEVPEFLGEAGNQVFFGYRSSLVSGSGWGSFQEWAPANVATWDLVEGPVALTTFATTPADPNLLVTPSGAAVFRFDASTTPPTIVARTWETSLDFDSRLSPDGTKLLTEGVSVTDAVSPHLTPLPTLPNYQDSSDTPYAGAYSADGRYVASGGVSAGGTPSQSTVKIWPEAGSAGGTGGVPLRALPVAGTIQSLGLGFTSDSSRVYAITADDVSGGHPVLHVRNWPLAPKTPWAWGWNDVGQLGNGGLTDASSAVSIPTGVVAVTAGWFHDLAVTADGSVWAWGWNATGQLGDGSTTDRHAPVRIVGLPAVVAVAAGELHSMALARDGTVWTWGWNGVGQLGDGTTVDRHVPVLVSGLHDIVAIAAGAHHNLALARDGTVWAWGWNGVGQLGDGTTVDRHVPVLVSGVSGVRSIAAGVLHSVVSDRNLQVWAWGGNHFGQLGTGTTTDSHVPVLVPSISGVRSVAAGGYHSIAVALLGTVSTWGWNAFGQLGDGTTVDRHTPVSVPALYGGVTKAAGGLAHTAVVANGKVLTWGSNSKGQLGTGTTTDGHVFGPVVGVANPVTMVAAGALHTVAM